jgi:3-oxoacyl-[acyl-carrier protein] reductase
VSRYAGRVALVTGAAQGLGHAVAERLAREGATVAVCDVDPDIAPVAQRLPAATGSAVTASVVDVGVAAQVNEWVAEAVDRFGRVDVLVNNAGVIRDSRLELMTDEEWQVVIDVSLRGTFNGCRAVFAQMKRQRYGRIVSMSSMCWRGNFGQANYTAAKAGIVGLARTVALEGAPHGITSNVIAPGLIDTPMLASMNAAARDKLTARIPARHVGSPDDIAEAAAFLCAEQARYVTGVVLDVDGGIGVGSALR